METKGKNSKGLVVTGIIAALAGNRTPDLGQLGSGPTPASPLRIP